MVQWTFKHAGIVHLLTLSFFIVGIFFAKNLELRTDFSELLPQKLPSVVSLKEAASRLGGTGLLIVGVIGPEFKSNKKFVDDFAARLTKEAASDIRFFEYKFDAAKQFGEKYGLHYLSIDNNYVTCYFQNHACGMEMEVNHHLNFYLDLMFSCLSSYQRLHQSSLNCVDY